MPVSPETRVADGFDFELFNATPFDLSVKYRGLDNGREVWGARPVTVRSLASDKQHGNYNLVAPYVQTSPHDGGGLTRVGIRRPEGEGLAVDREHPRWTIAPEDLVSWAEISSGALGTATTFVNETLGWVDVLWMEPTPARPRAGDMFGTVTCSTERLMARLEPGQQRLVPTCQGRLWMVRATFTSEVLAMFVQGSSPEPYRITPDFRDRKSKDCPLPAPTREIPSVSLVGGQRERPDPESRDYVVISAHDNLKKDRFNTRANVVTRTVKISGAKLNWKADNPLLMKYQGETVLDLESVEMYADHVVVAAPLRFPGTNVTIYARELEFTRDGQINTTPIAYKAPALSAYKTNDGAPADANGKPTYQAANGLPGEPGGNIMLKVRKITLPKQRAARPHLVGRGSDGQQGEAGGLKAYSPKTPDQPPATSSRTLPFVTANMVVDAIHHAAFPTAKEPYNWRWPQGVDWPGQIKTDPNTILGGMAALQPFQMLLPSDQEPGRVVHLRIDAYDDDMFVGDINTFYFPPGIRHSGTQRGALALNPVDDPQRKRPGDGQDAYPGGQPGNGGDGGKIAVSLFDGGPPSDEWGRALGLDCAPGQPGPQTAAIAGGPPGGPDQAYWVTMEIVKHMGIESTRQPTLKIENVTAKGGASASARIGEAGAPQQPRLLRTEGLEWLHPDGFDALLAFATDAYRREHRQLAREALDPYYAVLRPGGSALSDELQRREVSVRTMRDNLFSNLDYYGNPPGWLPRLRLSSNLRIFQQVRRISCNLLYYAKTMADSYDKLEHAEDLAGQTTAALTSEMDQHTEQLKDACTELLIARCELERIAEDVRGKQDQIDLLERWARADAAERVQRQKIFRGVMKMIGGLMKAVPVGQPYLGLAGDVTATVGDININDPGGITKQIGATLQTVGTKTDTFLKNNKDLIVADRVDGLRTSLNLNKKENEALEDQIGAAKSAQAAEEAQVKKYTDPIESTWKTEHASRLKQLNEALGEANLRVEALIAARLDEKEADQDDKKREARQQEVQAAAKHQELLAATIQEISSGGLVQERAALERQLAQLQTEIDAEKLQVGTTNAARLKVLEQHQVQVGTFARSASGLEQKLKKGKVEHERGTAELTRRKEDAKAAIDRLSGIGSGVSLVGEGIAALATPATTNDADVKALATQILASEKKAEMELLLSDFKVLGARQSAAMAKLAQSQQLVRSHASAIADGLDELNALSGQRQALDGALDVRARRYLQRMQERSRDTLRWSLYHLVMAFRYEHLRDVSDDFYQFDSIVVMLRKLESTPAPASGAPSAPKPAVSPAKLAETEDQVLQDLFLAEAKKILTERQHLATSKANSRVLALTPQLRETLRLTGSVTFNLIRDLNAGSFDWVRARITDINMKERFVADPKAPSSLQIHMNGTTPLRLEFHHSGESIVRASPKGPYYYFRAAPDDDPISWGFDYSPARAEGERLKKDTPAQSTDIVDQGLDKVIAYEEYFPSYFSDLTLSLTEGPHYDASAITEIKELQFEVSYLVNV